MLAVIKKAVLDYLESEAIVGGKNEGIKTFLSGPIESQAVPTAKYPYVSAYWKNSLTTFPHPSMSVYDCELILELYTVSMETAGEAEDECTRLVISDDETKGLLAAMKAKMGYQINGKSFLVRPSGPVQYRFGSKATDGFTYAAQIPLSVQTFTG